MNVLVNQAVFPIGSNNIIFHYLPSPSLLVPTNANLATSPN
jgi:hypothetical protein